jgi:DegV family protein with EDD domain
MNCERPINVVTDSGTSIRPEYPEAKRLGVTIIPLDITFYEGGKEKNRADLELSPEEFYQEMAASEKLPKTSGGIPGRALEVYRKLSEKTDSIISIHLTSEHSAVYGSALVAAQTAKEENPKLHIEVIDSRQITLAAWYPTLVAAELAKEGATLEEAKQAALATIPKTELYATLSSLKNIIAGGRVSALKGYLGMALGINPVLRVENGRLEEIAKARTFEKARKTMLEKIGNEDAVIIRMAVIHANNPKIAQELQQALAKSYSGKIPIYEVGPVLGVHAGEGTVGVTYQSA